MTTTAETNESVATRNPFLRGNYAPVQREVTATELAVTGTLPDYLDGRYLRTGPNPMGETDPRRYEWFTGTGMVHGLRIQDGQARWYRNRWVRSAAVARELGEPWPGGPHRAGFDFAANTNVIGLGGRTLALVEGGARPYELTEELETVASSDFCGTLRGGYTAHPKRDPATGELHAVSYSPIRGNRAYYTVTGVDGRVRKTMDIRLPRNTMMHDMALTERYVVLFDLPAVLDLAAMVRSRPAKAVASLLTRLATRHPVPGPIADTVMRGSTRTTPTAWPYRWDPAHRPRVGVLPRDGGPDTVRWFDVNPCFIYHTVNSHDDGERITIDFVRHDKVFDRGPGPVAAEPSLWRWTIDLGTGRVREEQLDDRAQEFPRADERRVGLRHRYGYTVGLQADHDGGAGTPNALLKHDFHRLSAQALSFGDHGQPGEFVFVPRSPDAAEDDGVVMGFVYHPADDRSDLVVADAATLETVATVHLPTRVPAGFHGNWVPTAG